MVHGKRTDNCERIKRLLQQNRKGITIKKIARRLDMHVTSVYRHLNHLDRTGEASYERGIAYPRNELNKTNSHGLGKKLGFLERKSKEEIEQRLAELAMLETYWSRRKEVDGLTRAPEMLLKNIREEKKLLRKRLDQSYG
jgi:predicted ArsR family transcriptional regulator